MVNQKYLFIASLFALLTTVGMTVSYLINDGKILLQQPIVCTMEAKLCPDGSYVGRTGPKCEFAKCSEIVEGTGIIKGKVTVGPICPVERPGEPCPVLPEAYTSREVLLYVADGSTVVKRMNFTAEGTYQFEVPVGMYILDIPRQGIGGTNELPKIIFVKKYETVEFNFSIDTGIR